MARAVVLRDWWWRCRPRAGAAKKRWFAPLAFTRRPAPVLGAAGTAYRVHRCLIRPGEGRSSRWSDAPASNTEIAHPVLPSQHQVPPQPILRWSCADRAQLIVLLTRADSCAGGVTRHRLRVPGSWKSPTPCNLWKLALSVTMTVVGLLRSAP